MYDYILASDESAGQGEVDHEVAATESEDEDDDDEDENEEKVADNEGSLFSFGSTIIKLMPCEPGSRGV